MATQIKKQASNLVAEIQLPVALRAFAGKKESEDCPLTGALIADAINIVDRAPMAHEVLKFALSDGARAFVECLNNTPKETPVYKTLVNFANNHVRKTSGKYALSATKTLGEKKGVWSVAERSQAAIAAAKTRENFKTSLAKITDENLKKELEKLPTRKDVDAIAALKSVQAALVKQAEKATPTSDVKPTVTDSKPIANTTPVSLNTPPVHKINPKATFSKECQEKASAILATLAKKYSEAELLALAAMIQDAYLEKSNVA